MSARTWWRRRGAVVALVGAGLFTLGCTLGGDLVSYDLPEDAQRYTLEVETDGVVTQWEYVSDRPTEGDAPESQPCLGEVLNNSQGECRPEPLIFLRYDLGLRLDDTVPARRPHEVEVTGYYQERLSDPPTVTDLQVEVSYDGGATWEEAATAAQGENTFTARYRPERGAESVSLRVSATDSQGNTVVQTMPDAYGVR